VVVPVGVGEDVRDGMGVSSISGGDVIVTELAVVPLPGKRNPLISSRYR
jgi:hypothetical protein